MSLAIRILIKNLHVHKAIAIFGMNRSALGASLNSELFLFSCPPQPSPPHSKPKCVSSFPPQSPQLMWEGDGAGSIPSMLPELHCVSGLPNRSHMGLMSRPLPRGRDYFQAVGQIGSLGTLGFTVSESVILHISPEI